MVSCSKIHIRRRRGEPPPLCSCDDFHFQRNLPSPARLNGWLIPVHYLFPAGPGSGVARCGEPRRALPGARGGRRRAAPAGSTRTLG